MVRCISVISALRYFGLNRPQIKAIPNKILRESTKVWYCPLDDLEKQYPIRKPIPAHIIKDLHRTGT